MFLLPVLPLFQHVSAVVVFSRVFLFFRLLALIEVLFVRILDLLSILIVVFKILRLSVDTA